VAGRAPLSLSRSVRQAEASVFEARFELSVEAGLRKQLQQKNADLAQRVAALEAAAAARQATSNAGHEHAAASARIESQLQLALAENARMRAQLELLRAAQAEGHSSTPTVSAAHAQVPTTASAGELATPRPSNLCWATASTASAAPSLSSTHELGSPSNDLQALTERVCSQIRVSADGRVPMHELAAFLAAVNALQPIGHEPRAKANSLCRDFGDGSSIPIADFKTILTKLANSRPARLLQLSNAWDAQAERVRGEHHYQRDAGLNT
jgi:hypothetical protein